jgi:transcriptional regulator with XRE-family HTH domain
MRPSPQRHPVAILRTIAGLGQKQLADLVGKSTPTIQSVELGKLPLSPGLAATLEEKTGACGAWMLAGDPSAPAIDKFGQPFTRETYERHQAALGKVDQITPGDIQNALVTIFENAEQRGTGAAFKLDAARAINDLAKTYGCRMQPLSGVTLGSLAPLVKQENVTVVPIDVPEEKKASSKKPQKKSR